MGGAGTAAAGPLASWPPGLFPPASMVQHYFHAWRDLGLWSSLNHVLLMLAREASPSVGVIDSQSVKTTESGGQGGFDAGKKINGCKRHSITDSQGLLAGAKLKAALAKIGRWIIQVVKRSGTAKGFEVIPRRWVVARGRSLLHLKHRMTGKAGLEALFHHGHMT